MTSIHEAIEAYRAKVRELHAAGITHAEIAASMGNGWDERDVELTLMHRPPPARVPWPPAEMVGPLPYTWDNGTNE